MGTSIRELIEMPPTQAEIDKFEVTDMMWAEALNYLGDHEEDLVAAAAFNQRHATSYRTPPFKVGCAVIGMGPKPGDGEYIVWQSHNFKPVPKEEHGEDKRCAERNALDGARSDCKVVFGIATSSEEVNTGDHNKSNEVLHPCKECRGYLRQLLKEGFLREETRIFNGNNKGRELIIEGRTLKEFLNLYSDDLL